MLASRQVFVALLRNYLKLEQKVKPSALDTAAFQKQMWVIYYLDNDKYKNMVSIGL